MTKDTRRLFINLDRVRRWDAGRLFQRFPQPRRVPITGLEPGPGGSADARVASIYGSVLKEGGLFRMWYTVMPDALSHAEDPDHMYTAYAESDDGLHWRKPDLRITGQKRYPGNNLTSLPGCTMGVVPALPATGAKYLTAVIGGKLEADLSEGFGYTTAPGTVFFVSDDGLHWHQLTTKPVAQQGDVGCLYLDAHEGRYLYYQKVGTMHGLDPRRSFICMTSRDGAHWDGYEGVGSWRESFAADDFDDVQAVQMGFRTCDHYGIAMYRAGNTYVAVEDIFLISDPLRHGTFAQHPAGLCFFRLGYSNNASHWRRPKGRPLWFGLGEPGEFDAGFMVPASTFLEHEDHLLLYYGGSFGDHGWSINVDFSLRQDIPLEVQRDSARVGLCTIRKDRFASLAATYEARFDVDAGPREGERLFVNALCTRGSLRAALIDRATGKELPGFSLDDCAPFSGDSTRAEIHFKGARVSDVPADRHLMVRFELRRCEIFGYEWGGP